MIMQIEIKKMLKCSNCGFHNKKPQRNMINFKFINFEYNREDRMHYIYYKCSQCNEIFHVKVKLNSNIYQFII
jgi:DNA-directed RNA polymerase subunit RPC12/RpoP